MSFAWANRRVRVLAFTVLAVVLLTAPDKPKNHQGKPKETGLFHSVPVGAIKIPLAAIEQPDDFSCGAAAFMSVCLYYNVGPARIEAYKHKLHTNPEEGTYYKDIARYAEKLGLKAEIETNMGLDKLKKHLDEGKPVICSIQAYSEDKHPDYSKNGNGHYVVAIGFDTENNFYFMDPSANYEQARANPRYAFLPCDEFKLRWHENEGSDMHPEVYEQLGIVIYPAAASPLLQARKIE